MPIHADTNLYPGINPHLNSQLQQPGGGWRSFHAAHIMHIFDILESTLPAAYYVMPESSLQIGVYDATVADVLVSRSGPTGRTALSEEATQPTLVLPLARVLDTGEDLTGLVIYRADDDIPVTRIELLSPANKPPGSHYGTYLLKRGETLQAGLRLVEIDYLHERRPVVASLPDYTIAGADSWPYHILVSDPRPSLAAGQARLYGFGVLDALPVVAVPLDEEDSIALDFGALYARSFAVRAFRRRVDYAQEPDNIAAYAPADREKIRNHMREIAAAQSE